MDCSGVSLTADVHEVPHVEAADPFAIQGHRRSETRPYQGDKYSCAAPELDANFSELNLLGPVALLRSSPEFWHQNSAFDLAFDNGASKSNSLSVGCGWPSNISNKCYHASSNRRVGG